MTRRALVFSALFAACGADAYCPRDVGWRVTLDALKNEVRGLAVGVGGVVWLAP